PDLFEALRARKFQVLSQLPDAVEEFLTHRPEIMIGADALALLRKLHDIPGLKISDMADRQQIDLSTRVISTARGSLDADQMMAALTINASSKNRKIAREV